MLQARLLGSVNCRGLMMASMLPDQPQKKGAINMLKRFIEGANLPVEGDHLRWQYFLNDKLTGNLFSRDFLGDIKADPFRLVRKDARREDTTAAGTRG